MSSSFTTRDLIELSLLDAMGLLDEEERADFELAFSATSPAIQSHIRREQTRLAHIDFLLPQVEPPADLRSAVIEAVRKAMAEGADRKVPQLAAFIPAFLPSRRVSPWWRAGAMGFATAAVIFGFTTLDLRRQFDDLDKILRDNQFTDQALKDLGPSFEEYMFSETTRHVVFRPASSEVQGIVALLLNSETGEATLICRKLPSQDGREYKLVVINDQGAVEEQLTPFVPSGLAARPIKVRLTNGQRLAILPPSDEGSPAPAPIFTTDPISI